MVMFHWITSCTDAQLSSVFHKDCSVLCGCVFLVLVVKIYVSSESLSSSLSYLSHLRICKDTTPASHIPLCEECIQCRWPHK